jgi:hypothetical protein
VRNVNPEGEQKKKRRKPKLIRAISQTVAPSEPTAEAPSIDHPGPNRDASPSEPTAKTLPIDYFDPNRDVAAILRVLPPDVGDDDDEAMALILALAA